MLTGLAIEAIVKVNKCVKQIKFKVKESSFKLLDTSMFALSAIKDQQFYYELEVVDES